MAAAAQRRQPQDFPNDDKPKRSVDDHRGRHRDAIGGRQRIGSAEDADQHQNANQQGRIGAGDVDLTFMRFRRVPDGEPGNQSQLYGLAGDRIGAGDHGLAGDNGGDGRQHHHRDE